MTGGGFGGCMVAIAHRGSVQAVQAAVQEKYDGAGYGPSRLVLTRPGPGATVEYARAAG